MKQQAVYDTFEGQKLLAETQKLPSKIWNIATCPYCRTKYNLLLVKWIDNTTQCPTCKRLIM